LQIIITTQKGQIKLLQKQNNTVFLPHSVYNKMKSFPKPV